MDKREHIIDIAINLFAEKGFEGTSIRDLATAAEVNVAMVNYYFGSKEKLFEAMIEHKSSYIRESLEEISTDKSKSEIEKIDAIIEIYVSRLLSEYKYHRVLHTELMLQGRMNIHEDIAAIFSRNREIMRNVIEAGIKKKVFKKVDPDLSIASIIGTINQVLLSKPMCKLIVKEDKNFNPYTDEAFKKRLITHLKQLAHSHLLNN